MTFLYMQWPQYRLINIWYLWVNNAGYLMQACCAYVACANLTYLMRKKDRKVGERIVETEGLFTDTSNANL